MGREISRQEPSLGFYNPEEKGGHNLDIGRKFMSPILRLSD